MAYNARRGGQGRSGNSRQQPQQMTPNEKISFEEAFKAFVSKLNGYRGQVEAVLPASVKFERFRAVIIMAIRRSPDLLECEPTSLINACIHSAHDGLMPDGREAVIVKTWNDKKKVAEASYRSMVFGLIKQIVKSGAAVKVQPFIVFANEQFDIWGGSEARIEHKIEPIAEKRGDPIGAYAVATLPGGETTFSYLTHTRIEEIRKIAQTDFVWARHWDEMALKTVIRNLRKRIAGTEDITDIEERLQFPQFATEPAPAVGAAGPRPTREQFQQLEHYGNEAGVPLDWGTGNDREAVQVSHERGAQQGGAGSAAKAADSSTNAAQSSEQAKQAPTDWPAWRDKLLAEIASIELVVDVNARWAAEREAISNAPDEIASEVNGAFNDRLTDIASKRSSDAAGASDSGQSTPAEEGK